MRFARFIPSTLTLAGLATLALAITGCDEDGATGPLAVTQLTQEISFGEFSGMLEMAPARIRIKLLAGDGPLVARKIDVRKPKHMAKDEKVKSNIVDPGFTEVETDPECRGTLALALDGVQLRFDGTTRFEDESDGDGDDDGDITCAEFVERVEAAIAAGQQPEVGAKRPPPVEPQDPDDPDFLATKIEIEDEDDDDDDGDDGGNKGKLDLNVDDDNLMACDAITDPPAGCLGVLQVLGLSIVIQDGVTRIRASEEKTQGKRKFEGIVASVDIDAQTFEMTDGRTVRIVLGTDIKDGGNDRRLGSLEEVQAALDDGETVEAEGEGLLESDDPIVIIAIKVEFEIEDDDDGDDD